MDSQKPEHFMSVKEFAYTVGWGEDTIRRLIKRNVIHAIILPQANQKKHRHNGCTSGATGVAEQVANG